MLALAYAAHVIGAGLNIIWFAVVFGMLASGAYRRRLGSCAASWLSSGARRRTASD